MNNFTKSNNKAYWHSVTNLTCCINKFSRNFKSRANSYLLLLVFLLSVSSLSAQVNKLNQTRSTDLNLCLEDIPSPFLESEVALLFNDACGGEDAIAVLQDFVITGQDGQGEGTDCGWAVVYTYDIYCKEIIEGEAPFDKFIIDYDGGDFSAPELVGDIPGDQSGINACLDEVPTGPTEAEIAALFEDNCGNVNVSKSGVPTGDNCDWSVKYLYTIVDDCDNYAESIEITFSGGDATDPYLAKGASIPSGMSGVNACFDSEALAELGPSEAEFAALFEDECGGVSVIKDAYFKGDDCGWKGEISYTVQDDCGNDLDPIILSYSGSDSEDPVLDSFPEDFSVTCIDFVPAAESINFTDNCTTEGKNKAESFDDLSNLGNFCEGGTIIRTWTATDDCGNYSTHSITITVEPAPAAEFDIPQDYTIDCTEVEGFQAQYLGYSNGGSGACDISGEVQGTPEPFDGDCGEFNVNYSYTDECDRTITAVLKVFVVDNIDPEIVDLADYTLDGCNADWPSSLSTTWSDNCADGGSIDSDAGVADGESADGCIQYRLYTFTVTDDCGNSDTETTRVAREYDETNPEIADLPDYTLDGCNADWPTSLSTTWSDNCADGGSIDSDAGVADGESADGCIQYRLYTFTVTDDCGNSDTETTRVAREYDETNPEISDLPDYTLDGCNADWPTKLTTTWSDNCADGGSIDSDAGVADGESADGCIQYRLYTFTVTDDCGNSDTETTRVAREYDETNPEIADLPDYTLDGCNADWPSSLSTTWSDNCADGGSIDSDAGVADGESADGCIQYRLYTFTVTDDCGNSDTETTRVAREYDETNPEIADLPDYTLDGCNADWPTSLSTTWSDNCADGGSIDSDAGVADGESADGCIQYRLYTFTVTDDCGNSDTETTRVAREYDETNPEIADLPDYTLDGCNADWPTSISTTWSDNCADGGSIDSDAGVADGESADGCIQYRLYTFTVTDDCGNSDTKTTRVAREYDETNPEIADLPDYTLDGCNADWPTKLTTTWSDNCADGGSIDSDAGVADGESADGCIQYRLYTFTVTDDCGNSDTETTRVAREYDETDPEIADLPDYTLDGCNADWPTSLSTTWSDNCADGGSVDSDAGVADGESADGCIQYRLYTFTVTDDCGNSDTETTRVAREYDETNPEIADLPDYTLDGCNADWPTKLTTTWSDNCADGGSIDSDAGVADGESADGCIQYRLYTFTVTDDCGNSDTETTRVAREYDETNPEIADLPDYTLDGCNADWPTSISTTWSDNCADGGSVDSDAGVADGESADGCIQYRLYTFTVTDDCGNSDTETTRVAREYDETNPEISDLPDYTLDGCNADWPTKLTTTWSDNCADGGSIDSDAGVADGESADGCIQYRLYSFTVTDDCGNSDTETTRVAREYDITDPVFGSPPADVTLDCSEDIPSMTELSWSDNCSGTGKVLGEDSELDGACGTITRTWTYTDECGNTATATQMITIEDNEPPVLECVCDIMVGNNENTNCEAYVNINNVIATDNCGEPTLTYSHDINGTFPVGDTVVTVTAEDACGNKSTCEFTITVVNNCMTDCCEVGNKPSVMTFTYTGEDCSATMTTQGTDKYGCNGDPAMASTVYIIASSGDNGSGDVYFAGEVNLNEFYTISAANAGQSQLNNNTIITIYDSQGGNILQVSNFHASCSQPLGSGDQFGANLINGIQFDDGYVCGEVDAPPIPEDCCDIGNKPSIMTFTYTGEDCSASIETQDPDKAECSGDPAMAASVYIVASDGGSDIYFAGTVGLNEMYTISAANAGQSQLNNNTIIYIYAYEGGPLLQEANFHASCSQPLGSGNQFGANYVNGIQFDDGYVCGEVDAPPIPEDCCDIGNKPSIMTFIYTGEDCSASIGTQDPDKAECSGDPAMAASVYIVVSDGGSDIYFAGTVGLNEMYTISAANAGQSQLNNNTIIYIYAYEGGPLLQEANFHASCSQPLGSGNQFGANYVNGIQFDDGYVCGEVDAPPIPEDCCDIGNKPSIMTFTYTGEDCSASIGTQDPDKAECSGDPAMAASVYIVVSDGGSDIYFAGTVGLNEMYTISAANAGQSQLNNNTIIYIYAYEGGPLLQEANFHASCSQPLGSGNQFGANYVNGIQFDDGYVCGEVDAPPIPEDCCDIGNKPSIMTFTYTGEDCSASIGTQDPDKAECSGDPAMAASVYIVVSDGGSDIYFAGTVGLNEMYTISAANAGQSQLNNNTIIYIYAYEGGPLLQEANFHASCSQPLGSGNQFGANYVNGIQFDDGYVCGEVDAPPIPEDCCDSGNKPTMISFKYTGEDCSATSTQQSNDKYSCDTYSVLPDVVYIIASSGEDGTGDIWFSGEVGLNESYTIYSQYSGASNFPSNTVVTIYDGLGGSILQRSNFHTSCSQPLGSGNQFGSNLIEGILFDNGYICGQVCLPPESETPGDCCDIGNKPSVMTFTYTGEDCSASIGTQDPDKAECFGDPGLAASVYIVSSDGGSEIYFSGTVGLNEIYTISASNAGQTTLNNNTIIYIYAYEGGPLLQEANFHASCSQPLGSGNQFGANFVNGILFDDGYVCGDVDAPPAPADCCDLGNKPSVMTFIYTGEDCSASQNTQDPSKAECTGNPAMDTSVYIIASDGGSEIYFSGLVGLNEAYTISAANAGESQLNNNSIIYIYAYQGGPLLQEANFHASCSQPLGAGNQFGANFVQSILFDDGYYCEFVDEEEYSYENSGDVFFGKSIQPNNLTISMNVYPNPFELKATIDFTLANDDHVKVEVFNLRGQLVQTIYDGQVRGGQFNQAIFNPMDTMAAGIYLIKLQSDSGIVQHKRLIYKP